MSRFKVEDKVRVRKDLVVGKEYGGQLFTTGMSRTIGKETKIRKCYRNGYALDDCLPYAFTDGMLEPVEEFEKGDLVEITKGALKGVKGKVNIVGNYSMIRLMIDSSTHITIKKDNIKLISKAKEEGTCSIANFGEKCKYILQGDKTTVILPSGTKGQVKLYKGDKYDKDLGIRLAYHKAKFNEAIKEIENN